MKKINNIYIGSLLALGLVSCANEAPFTIGTPEGTGGISKESFILDVKKDESVRQKLGTKANDTDLSDFKITFKPVRISTYSSNELTYKYSELPEVVTLDAGTYKVTAEYGENLDAQFENPYYKGESGEFTVKVNEITTDIGTITCNLENVKVSIVIHPSLSQRMSSDAHVEVKVNNSSPLKFTKDHSENEIAGYFKHNDENTLVATFKGEVDGVQIEEQKILTGVTKGNHYRITFMRHEYNGEESGNVNAGVGVDASVTVTDVNRNVTIPDDEILDDNERPKEEDPSTGDNPGQENPTPDDPDSNKPKILAMMNPETNNDDIDLSICNTVTSKSFVSLEILCPEGFKEFTVNISDNLDLDGILPNNLDLINPAEEDIASLVSLKLLKEGETSLKGKTEAVFNVTDFMPLLCNGIFGEQEYIFTIFVKDNKNASVTKQLRIWPVNED